MRIRGIDLEAKAELTNNLSLTAAYSYLDPEIVENGGDGTEGNRPQFVSQHIASLWANYTLPGSDKIGDMTFGLGGRYTGAYYFTAANTSGAGGNVVFDAAFSYEFLDNSTLEVNVSNLFDKNMLLTAALVLISITLAAKSLQLCVVPGKENHPVRLYGQGDAVVSNWRLPDYRLYAP